MIPWLDRSEGARYKLSVPTGVVILAGSK